MPIQLGDQTAELLMKRAVHSSQVASENYEFSTNQSRLNHQSRDSMGDALAARVVLESGSGRVRITDPTTAGMKPSA